METTTGDTVVAMAFESASASGQAAWIVLLHQHEAETMGTTDPETVMTATLAGGTYKLAGGITPGRAYVVTSGGIVVAPALGSGSSGSDIWAVFT